MNLRVVLYAEGSRELGTEGMLEPIPGTDIDDEHLGPAHLLVRRAISEQMQIPEPAVCFKAPLLLRGHPPRGSDFLHKTSLRRLLTWFPGPIPAPDLAIVLVDADGERDRRSRLLKFVSDLPVRRAVGVAVQEFEAWLIADHAQVVAALGSSLHMTKDPETLSPGEAKIKLAQWMTGRKEGQSRRTLASCCDLRSLAARCPSFSQFLEDLRPVP